MPKVQYDASCAGPPGRQWLSLREGKPRTSSAPCPNEERPRQAGLLARGSRPVRPPSRGIATPMA